ncbi:four-carbon acid sugar kinase family protein [Haloarcula nitratireducens]|uniref:Four-carbon acid sugar kinase family protein n=1 Tax=Haloarcula nitratireducens TaxID=2487749 RepID=A0AAW4PFF3_9EURY|nr:four-carbon acid sugar kinase family protein [Halomicroarcula nitratireducens]MBX0296398.1 four-carbon acid sugar kinase family protein [Halomicroarcula nitratireducens]
MTRCLVVADDLTGSCDAGHEFATRGYDTSVVLSAQTDTTTRGDVAVYNTESRYEEPAVAADRVRAVLQDADPSVAFKKVDSTLRGNVRAEIDAATRATAPALVVVAPAFPDNGRLTACGYHLVDGQLVTDSPPGNDEERPPTHDSLPELFASSEYPVERIGVDTVARGTAAVREAFESATSTDGPVIVTCDAVTDSHLAAIATAADSLSGRCLYVGSGGLARHVAVPGTPSGAGIDVDPTRPVVGVSGSVAPETLEQLEAVPQGQRRHLDVETAVTDPSGAGAELASRGITAVGEHGGVLLHSADERGDVDRAMAAGERAGVDGATVRRRITDALAAGAAEVAGDGLASNLFLTGGETARAVLDGLDATALRMAGESVAPGIPLATVEGGVADGAAAVTKAGGFGDEQAIIKSLARLGLRDE